MRHKFSVAMVIPVAILVGVLVGLRLFGREPTSRLGPHVFEALFPISLSSAFATDGPGVIDVHSLESPPDFRVSLLPVLHRAPSSATALGRVASSFVAMLPGEHLRAGSLQQMPPGRRAGNWLLTQINGFARQVNISQTQHGFWSGIEIAVNEKTRFMVQASSTSLAQIRAFLGSYVPVS